MSKPPSMKPSDVEKYANLDLHQLEEIIKKMQGAESVTSHSSAQRSRELSAARYALRKRQRLLKGKVMAFEASNDHYLLFFDSTSGFSKIAGRSVLFYALTIAGRLGQRYTIKNDTDRYEVSATGTISFRSLDQLTPKLAELEIFPNPELSTSELHYYKLAKVYTPEEIQKLEDNSRENLAEITAAVLPESPLPLLYDTIVKASLIVYHEVTHISNSLVRETIGRRLLVSSYELVLAYLDYAHASQPLSTEYLEKILRLSRDLRNGMAYTEKIQIMSQRHICRLLEQLVIIDRLAKTAYLKNKRLEASSPLSQKPYVKKSKSSLTSKLSDH